MSSRSIYFPSAMIEAPEASPPSPKTKVPGGSPPLPEPESELAYFIKKKFSRVMREGEPFHPAHLRRTDRVMLCSYCKERVVCSNHEDHKMVDHFCSKHGEYAKFLDDFVNMEIPPRLTAEQLEERRQSRIVISGSYHFDDNGVATQFSDLSSSDQGPKEKKQKTDPSVLDFLSGRLKEKKHKTYTGTSNGHTSGFTVLPADQFVIDSVPFVEAPKVAL